MSWFQVYQIHSVLPMKIVLSGQFSAKLSAAALMKLQSIENGCVTVHSKKVLGVSCVARVARVLKSDASRASVGSYNFSNKVVGQRSLILTSSTTRGQSSFATATDDKTQQLLSGGVFWF